MTERKRDFAMNVNRVDILGRVTTAPKNSKDDKITRVRVVTPIWAKGGGHNWNEFVLDVTGDNREKAKKATVGDFFKCVARIADRQIKDDEGEIRSLQVLQVDPFREVGVMAAEAPGDPKKPEYFGICHARIVLAGRNFIRKKQLEEGKKTPITRDGNNGKYCYVKITYEDPYQPPPTGEDYYQSLFLETSLNGKTAEIVGEYCRHRAQVLVFGNLSKKESDMTIKGQHPMEPCIFAVPGGFSFVNLDMGGGGGRKEPEPAHKYDDADDVSGIDGVEDTASSEPASSEPDDDLAW